ncbi:MAG: exodeoxyribonuclease III [bacterium]
MRIASWNVNSIKARLPRLSAWLTDRRPDILLMQETKATAESFPVAAMAELGYTAVHTGSGRWNGVAVLARSAPGDVLIGLPDQPAVDGAQEARAIGATVAGVRLWSLYVPNGRSVGSPHYAYKLDFLAAVQAQAEREVAALGPDTPFALIGDFNVAPSDDDVWDIDAFAGSTHVSADERAAVERITSALGLHDLPPRASVAPDDTRPPYTFWEMRMLGFQKGRGMRIDLALANDAFRRRVHDVWVDRDARRGEGPSDHAPLVLDLD